MTNANAPINSIPDLNEHPSSWYGLTKREHFAAMSIGVAESFLRDVSANWIVEYLNLPKGTNYNTRYYLQALAKLQCEMADDLINALNEPTNDPQ